MTEWIKRNIKCCACGQPMANSKHVNDICLDKEATWDYPVWNNILVVEKHPEKRATAIICDNCVETKRKIKYAVGWNRNHSNLKYYPVEQLKDLPPITKEETLQAETKNFGLLSKVEKR
ncbi:MAG: hypothetical protein QHH17_06845 [Candidatus Bathyarchaeota archaeon]|nr:hypothetical protein [Candidatus Bathyarchaeota archaeon]